MRILHLYKAYPPVRGGIENTIDLLATAQAAQGHQVTVVVSASGLRGASEDRQGVRVVRLGRLVELASTPLSPFLPLEVLRQGADIAHLHMPFPPAEVANLLCGRARRTVITYHSDVVRQRHILRLYRPLLRLVLGRAHRIFPTSEAYVRRSPFLSRVAHKCHVIPLGISLERFLERQPDKAAALRERWLGQTGQAATPGGVLLFVGRLRAYKGLPFLLQAMTRVDALLVIVGDGPQRAPLERLVDHLGLRHRVVFTGSVHEEQLALAYQASDLFVLPSHLPSEAFGLVMVEAMASGLPVICTELGTGTSAVNLHNSTGLVVPPADPAGLAAAIGDLLCDPVRRQRLGAAGRKRAQQEFSAELYVERTLQAYQDVLCS